MEPAGKPNGRWIGRSEALERLGVKVQTLYAYVSRGRISARPDPDNPRRSQYAAEDITRLSTPTIPGETPAPFVPFEQAPARGEALIRSSLSLVSEGRLFYRGKDAIDLSKTATVEDAARLLWDARDANLLAGLGPRLDGAGGVSPRTRMFASLARRAEEDPSSAGKTPEQVKAQAASVLNEVIDAVAGPGPRLFFHQRLGRGWKVLERDSPIIRQALILIMDHGINPAVIATRAAAGGGASPAGAALAGLATFTASPQAFELAKTIAYVIEARREPRGAAERRMADDGRVPGFGDAAWPEGDPRAEVLIATAQLPADLIAIAREGEAASGVKPNIGLALALVARRLDLPRDGASDMLLIGRLVGLLGHALDQTTDGSPIAARLRYVGPRPGA
ncbi:MAG TPA: citrate/2-methylcitrate synthase [Brevundimonas sp.]|jgi:citrate synthase